MNCPRCDTPTLDETLQEFGGVCPKCLLSFSEEKDAPAFPNLEIVGMLGQGGMGVVYKALQKNLNRTVALKVLSPHLSDDPEFLGRFTREAQALAQLSHPNIVAIHDSGVHDRVPYLVMEYVEGRSLRALLAAKDLTAEDALKVVPQICDALQYAHSKGVVHRDIKPENILIDAAGSVKIADYGLAKIASIDQPRLTKSNFVMGTPHYMAPEQIENSSTVDHRADIYSLGVVFYEMLTGELPLGRFKAPSERAEVDRRLDPVVLKSLEREPGDRYQSAEEVKDHVSRLKNRTAALRSRTGYVPPEPPSPLKKAAFVIANLGGLALGASIILSLLHGGTLTNLMGTIGMALLMASLVLWIFDVLRRGLKKALGGHVGWIAGIGFIVVMFGLSLLSDKSTPGDSPPQNSRAASLSQLWNLRIPSETHAASLLTYRENLAIVSDTELRFVNLYTGKLISSVSVRLAGTPLYPGPEFLAWTRDQLMIIDERDQSMTKVFETPIPCPCTIVGAAVRRNILYAFTDRNAVFAFNFVLKQVEWKREDLPITPIGEPILSELNVILFDRHSQRLILNRDDGGTKSQGGADGASDRMAQWETGWGILRMDGIHAEFNTYQKESMELWTGVRSLTAPDFEKCFMTVADRTLIVTLENRIYGQSTNQRFAHSWSAEIARTCGRPAAIGEGLVAVPTVQGVVFYRVKDGRNLSISILPGADEVLSPSDNILIAGSGGYMETITPKSGDLTGYIIRPGD